MRISKFLVLISTCSFSLTNGIPYFVSCKSNEQSIMPSNIEQFIYDRTFSLMAYSIIEYSGIEDIGAFCYGTGWIIDDATPQITSDYKYHVATNWHVIAGFHDLAIQPYGKWTYKCTIYNYADSSCANDERGIIDSYKEYISLGEAKPQPDGYYWEEENPKTFLYGYNARNNSNGDLSGIDLYEVTIDFASKNGSVGSAAIKEKLDRLNEYRKNNHYISVFAHSDNSPTLKKKKYIGGYPFKEKNDSLFGGKWETHEVNSGLYYVNYHNHYVEATVDGKKVYDVSPQYDSKINMGNSWMTGGASGSMLVTEDCEICGIYWGGWRESPYSEKFYPSFSLFKTINKNFLDKYIKSNIY